MSIKIIGCCFEEIKEMITNNINNMRSPFDSFLEGHILKSDHYKVLLDLEAIGYFSIYDKSLLTQFYIDRQYTCLAQEIFDRVKRYQYVQKAFVYTGDEFFLSHAIDYSRKIEPQAYFFQDLKQSNFEEVDLENFSCRVAIEEDIGLISEKSGGFFDDIVKQVSNQEIFIMYLKDQVVSFGIIEKSKLYENIASIGMFTVSEHRQKGIGRNTLLKLKKICYESDLIPIAGCWYYNHNSKKTLQRAGLFSQSRLLVVHL